MPENETLFFDARVANRWQPIRHPNFLRLMSMLVSHVNGAAVRYVLPFASKTKAEMVARLPELGLESLARMSISCILHPLRRQGWQQCGHCPTCVFRRQALITAGIVEPKDAYAVDLFANPRPGMEIAPDHMRTVQLFHQQIAQMRELDSGEIPPSFKRYLMRTNAVTSHEQLAPHAEVYRRYRKEWLLLIADARRRGLSWVTPARGLALAQGAN